MKGIFGEFIVNLINLLSACDFVFYFIPVDQDILFLS